MNPLFIVGAIVLFPCDSWLPLGWEIIVAAVVRPLVLVLPVGLQVFVGHYEIPGLPRIHCGMRPILFDIRC